VNAERAAWALGVVLLLVVLVGVSRQLVGVSGQRWSAVSHRATVARLAAGHGIQIAHARAQVMTAAELVAAMTEGATEDAEVIAAQAATIAALRGELRSTSRVDVVIPGETTEAPITPGGDPVSIGCRLGDMVVGTATMSGGELSCTTLDLRARVHLALSDTDGAAIVEVATGEEWVELPSSMATTTTGPRHRAVRPELRLGVVGGVEWPAARARVMPALSLQWLHPTPDWDLLGVRVAVDATTAAVGVDAVCYRVGRHLPLVDAVRACLGAGYTSGGAGLASLILEVPL